MSHYGCKKCHKRYDDCSCAPSTPTHDHVKILDDLKDSLAREPWSNELEGFTVVEYGDWTDQGKTESKTDIVKHDASGFYFEVGFSRYGDHWQGYETEFESAVEVVPYLKTITAYQRRNREAAQ